MNKCLGNKIAIFGASGQGREVADVCAKIGYDEIVFLVNDKTEKCIYPHKAFLDTKEKVDELNDLGFSFAIGIGSPKVRKIIADKYYYINFPNIIHPSATFGLYQKETIDKSKGNFIAAGVRFTNNVKCGNYCLFNLNATIAHDCIIEDYVSVMAAVNVSGNVHIKQNAYIGVNAAILQGNNETKIIVGENSIVGAGAVITKDVPPNVTVVGVPAKILLAK